MSPADRRLFFREKKFSHQEQSVIKKTPLVIKQGLVFLWIQQFLFAGVDADECDHSDQNHHSGGTEAEEIFPVFVAEFFDAHNTILHNNNQISYRQCILTLHLFFSPRRAVRNMLLSGLFRMFFRMLFHRAGRAFCVVRADCVL